MPSRKTKSHPRRLKAELNKRRAVEMRIAGATYQEIGDALSVSKVTAHNYIWKTIEESADFGAMPAAQLREMEELRLDDAMRRLVESEAYQSGEPSSINSFVRLSESRRKLKGIDIPVRQEVEQSGEQRVVVEYVSKPVQDVD